MLINKNKCENCNKPFWVYPYKFGIQKFCSKSCHYQSRIGEDGYWLGKKRSVQDRLKMSKAAKGRVFSEETRNKMSMATRKRMSSEDSRRKLGVVHLGERNTNWKGDDVGYRSLHRWVISHKGKAKQCIVCGKISQTEKDLHWANLDGKYKRNLDDFTSLCAKCHKRWDLGKLPINLFEWQERRILT